MEDLERSLESTNEEIKLHDGDILLYTYSKTGDSILLVLCLDVFFWHLSIKVLTNSVYVWFSEGFLVFRFDATSTFHSPASNKE